MFAELFINKYNRILLGVMPFLKLLVLLMLNKGNKIRRFITALIILLLPTVIFVSYVDFNSESLKTVKFKDVPSKLPTYLINTSSCKIPDLDPWNDDVLPFFAKEEYEPCSKKPLLTYIEKVGGVVKLKMNQSVTSLYSSLSIKCCYSYILRKDGDSTVAHSTCENFHNEVTISYPFIRVTCRNIFRAVYRNVHATLITKDFENNLSSAHDSSTKKWKIFLLGIDSISNLNLQRTMPILFSHLERNLIGFKGYNKIEDNTFPNLMALLSGRSMDTLEPICMRNKTFDDCDMLWKSFRESGFITAYGEDEPSLNTFNYYKLGFSQPPTNVYLRPYFLSADLLPVTYKHNMGVCTGPENTAERMLNSAKEFLTTFKHNPTFGFYWLNSFSHDNVNFASTMDEKLVAFLQDPVIVDALSDSIFVIFSDHGFRFGDIRFTYSGWLEERLPFLYFKFPQSFRETYPQFVDNFIFNAQNRLTTPYDFHMTLQHLLKLSNHTYNIKPSLGCPKCKSLFDKVESNRTCEVAGIPKHWCTCEGYTYISTNCPESIRVAEYVVNHINQIFDGFSEEGYKCARYTLSSIQTVGKSNSALENGTVSQAYLIMIKTYPYAMFEATVRTRGKNFEQLGQISRLNKYREYSSCIHNDVLKKYCFCDSWTTKILSHICYLFQCPIY